MPDSSRARDLIYKANPVRDKSKPVDAKWCSVDFSPLIPLIWLNVARPPVKAPARVRRPVGDDSRCSPPEGVHVARAVRPTRATSGGASGVLDMTLRRLREVLVARRVLDRAVDWRTSAASSPRTDTFRGPALTAGRDGGPHRRPRSSGPKGLIMEKRHLGGLEVSAIGLGCMGCGCAGHVARQSFRRPCCSVSERHAGDGAVTPFFGSAHLLSWGSTMAFRELGSRRAMVSACSVSSMLKRWVMISST